CRFQTLNDFWTQLPDGLTTPTVAGGWTHNEITMLVDKVRRLHAELSDLLRIFSTGFGKMILEFFVFSYINILISFFYYVHIDFEQIQHNTVDHYSCYNWIYNISADEKRFKHGEP
ncbi:Gustatory receptor, partial [Aphis craccivora]